MTAKELAEYIYKRTGFFVPDYVLDVILELLKGEGRT